MKATFNLKGTATLALILALLTPQAFAGGGVIGSAGIAAAERNEAIRTFLSVANNPNSKLGKRIAAINAETTDGRNREGSISLPITEDMLQVVLLENESINAWKYADKKDGRCVGSDSNSKFLIMLLQRANFNSGYSTSSTNFIVETEHQVSTDIIGGSDTFCDEVVSEDGADKFANYRTKSVVLSFQEASIK